jgi:uncharacterized membrane protein
MIKFIEWLKADWLMKLGALLLLLALGWFLVYAFAENWVGPMGRIALGLLAGAGLIAWGNFQISKRPVVGQVLVATGATAILLTVFAAREVYEDQYFTAATALGIMALTVALTAVLSIAHRTLALAVLALLGGAIAPLLSGARDPNMVVLLTYIFLLDLGVLAVVAMRGWRSLIPLALIITATYSFPAFYDLSGSNYLRSSGSMNSTVWFFMFLFYGLFFLASLASVWRNKYANTSDLMTSGVTALITLAWVAEFVPRDWRSIILAVATVVSVALVAALFRKGVTKEAVYMHSGIAVVLLGAATAFELHGIPLTTAFILEVLATIVVARYGLKDIKAAIVASLLQVIPIALALPSLGDYGLGSSVFSKDFFVLLLITISLAATTWIFQRIPKAIFDSPDLRGVFISIFSALSALFAVALIWLGLEAALGTINLAHGTALVIYTLAGLLLFYQGVRHAKKMHKFAGGILLALVVVHLLIIEIWTMSIGGKIITFLLVGALLISTAFFPKFIPKNHA